MEKDHAGECAGAKPPLVEATGPISAMMCSVLAAGWQPVTAGFWNASVADAYLEGALFNDVRILVQVQRDLIQVSHPRSNGMDNSVFAKEA